MSPRFSIVTPVYRPDLSHLEAAVASVRAQTFVDWEWVIVDDGSEDPQLTGFLATLTDDNRIHVSARASNGGIVAATNDALDLAVGEFVAFLDQDDLLADVALERVAAEISANPQADLLYSDRGHVDTNGNPTGRVFLKPDWSPVRLAGNMYLAHLMVIRRQTIVDVGGLREAYEGAQDHDLALRVTERTDNVVHLPEVLYWWRQSTRSTAADGDAKPYARDAGLQAVADHYARRGEAVAVAHTWAPGFYRLSRSPGADGLASIIIPTMGAYGPVAGEQVCLVVELARSIAAHRYQTPYEVVVVFDERDGVDTSYLADLRALHGERLRAIPFDQPFNFSQKINSGALHANGDVLVVLNDDMAVETPTWLDELVALARTAGIGAVGAKLLFPDGTVQHSGLEVAPPADIHNADTGHASDYGGYFGSLVIDHEVVGVTGACLAVRRETFFAVGGFPEDLRSSFNDVDFCFRLLDQGYRNVVAMGVDITHFESASRDPQVYSEDFVILRGRWAHRLAADPYLRERSKPIWAPTDYSAPDALRTEYQRKL